MLKALALIGLLLEVPAAASVTAASLAIPFWACWTVFGIGKLYFGFLPYRWHEIPFWNCIGIFVSIAVIRAVFFPRTPAQQQINKIARA